MRSFGRRSKLTGLAGPRDWAAVCFGDDGLDLAVGRAAGREVNVLQQTSVAGPVAAEGTEPLEPKARWQAAARSLREQINPKEHHVVTEVGCEDVMCQVLRLPTAQPSEMQQMLDIQIDTLTPLPLEDIVYSFIPLEVVEGQTRVLVAIARKDAVNDRVEALELAGLPAEAVGVDALTTFAALLGKEQLARDEKLNVLAVLNAATAHVIVHSQGQPLAVRSLVLGATTLGTPEGRVILGDELQRTLVAVESAQPQLEPGRLTVLATNAELQPVAELLTQLWGRAAEILINGAAPPQALGLCQQAATGALRNFNLLPAEWRERRHTARRRRQWIAGLIALGIVYVLAIGAFATAVAVQRSRLSSVQAEVKSVTPKYEAAKQLHSQLLAMQKQLDTKYSALEVLREVSVSLPENLKLNAFTFKKDLTVVLRGQAQANSQVLEFGSKLELCGLFANVKTSSQTQPGGGLTRFEITCSLKSADGAATTHGPK